MSLRSRISRIESASGPVRVLEVAAADLDDLAEKLFFSASGPVTVRVTGSVAGEPFDEMHELLSHEDYLELLD
ncbi:hypothetical protein ABUE31_04805 [Mesorhizobium sp. ZMM04-5]|uniref:Uncharacterized protein n=1 Tax=Mesorhizobium marinum TaxID=3228790 RepID=A0ABV3QWJ5_9HYPH